MSGRKAVFLDLDGTLVRDFQDGDVRRGPRNVSELDIPEATDEAMAQLVERFALIVITNQPDIERGLIVTSQYSVLRFALRMRWDLARFLVCPHDSDVCACRKPQPGLLFTAAVLEHLDLSRCWMVGDRETDREAAIRAGIPQSQTILIPTNQGIAQAVQHILEHDHEA
jgi:D-glycero-D-manno-heptose 1,7-bisphosphate phosphatase